MNPSLPRRGLGGGCSRAASIPPLTPPWSGGEPRMSRFVGSEAVLVLVIVIEVLEITESITSTSYAHEHEKTNWRQSSATAESFAKRIWGGRGSPNQSFGRSRRRQTLPLHGPVSVPTCMPPLA